MTEHETDVVDEYGLRLGQELHPLSARALRPFDAAAIAHEVASGRPRAAHPFPSIDMVRRVPRPLSLVLVALATMVLVAMLVVAGQQPSPPLAFAPGSIAFTRDYELYIAAADGTHQVLVAQSEPETNQIIRFAFAPDRAALAFSRDGPSGAELVVVAPDGRTLASRAFDDPETATWFSWAPDGDQMVMSLAGDRPQLSIVGLDGQVMRTLALPDGFTWGWLPDLGSWSPDGRWIAVFGCIAPCDIKFDPHILLVATDGSGSHWLTTRSDMTGYTTRELWSPDSRLTLANERWGTVEILATDGSTEQEVYLPGLQAPSAWSPDGSRLAVGAWTLRLVDRDGTVHGVPVDRVTPPPAAGDDPPTFITGVGWSPDGADLLFAGGVDMTPAGSLYAIDPQGGTPRLLIEDVDEGFGVAGS